MIKVYKTQPFEAEQFDGSDDMINRYGILDAGTMFNSEIHSSQLYLPFSDKRIEKGDWIITSPEGCTAISDVDFHENYRQLPEIPKYVADWIEECKQKYTSIGDMLCSERRPEKVRDWMAFTPGTYKFDYARYRKYQELVANAWINGYQLELQSN